MPNAREHPLFDYTHAMLAAHAKLVSEAEEQRRLASSAPTAVQRAAAQMRANELDNEIDHLDDAHAAFLVRVFSSSTSAPAQAVVDETVKLNKDLADVVVGANRTAVMLTLVQSFLQGAIKGFQGDAAAP